MIFIPILKKHDNLKTIELAHVHLHNILPVSYGILKQISNKCFNSFWFLINILVKYDIRFTLTFTIYIRILCKFKVPRCRQPHEWDTDSTLIWNGYGWMGRLIYVLSRGKIDFMDHKITAVFADYANGIFLNGNIRTWCWFELLFYECLLEQLLLV